MGNDYTEFYENLVIAIIASAVNDYVECGKVVVSFENPGLSENTNRKWKTLRNNAKSYVTNAYNTENMDEIKKAGIIRNAMETTYERNKIMMRDAERFFHSRSFEVLSGGCDGDMFLSNARKKLNRWVEDGKGGSGICYPRKDRIKAAIREQGNNMAELSVRNGHNPSYISMMVDKNHMTVRTAKRFCKELNIDYEECFTHE